MRLWIGKLWWFGQVVDCGRWSLMRSGGYKLRTFDCIRWKCCQPRLCSNRAWWPLKLHFCSWATRKSYFFHTNHMLGTLDFTVSEHPGLPLIFVRAQSWQCWIHSLGLQGSLGVECLSRPILTFLSYTHKVVKCILTSLECFRCCKDRWERDNANKLHPQIPWN